MKENLLRTCRKCHPDATDELPGRVAQPLHPDPRPRPPSSTGRALAYQILIPGVVGGMVLFVGSDFVAAARGPASPAPEPVEHA